MKRLACWIGRHKWELRIDHGEEFKVCAVCGKRPRKSGGRAREDREQWTALTPVSQVPARLPSSSRSAWFRREAWERCRAKPGSAAMQDLTPTPLCIRAQSSRASIWRPVSRLRSIFLA